MLQRPASSNCRDHVNCTKLELPPMRSHCCENAWGLDFCHWTWFQRFTLSDGRKVGHSDFCCIVISAGVGLLMGSIRSSGERKVYGV